MEALIALFALGLAGVAGRDADRGARRAHAREPAPCASSSRRGTALEAPGAPRRGRGRPPPRGRRVGRESPPPRASRSGGRAPAAAAPDGRPCAGPRPRGRRRAVGAAEAPRLPRTAGGADFATNLGPKILVGAGGLAVVVFLGFFVRYAWENNWVGPTGRVLERRRLQPRPPRARAADHRARLPPARARAWPPPASPASTSRPSPRTPSTASCREARRPHS